MTKLREKIEYVKQMDLGDLRRRMKLRDELIILNYAIRGSELFKDSTRSVLNATRPLQLDMIERQKIIGTRKLSQLCMIKCTEHRLHVFDAEKKVSSSIQLLISNTVEPVKGQPPANFASVRDPLQVLQFLNGCEQTRIMSVAKYFHEMGRECIIEKNAKPWNFYITSYALLASLASHQQQFLVNMKICNQLEESTYEMFDVNCWNCFFFFFENYILLTFFLLFFLLNNFLIDLRRPKTTVADVFTREDYLKQRLVKRHDLIKKKKERENFMKKYNEKQKEESKAQSSMEFNSVNNNVFCEKILQDPDSDLKKYASISRILSARDTSVLPLSKLPSTLLIKRHLDTFMVERPNEIFRFQGCEFFLFVIFIFFFIVFFQFSFVYRFYFCLVFTFFHLFFLLFFSFFFGPSFCLFFLFLFFFLLFFSFFFSKGVNML